MTRPESVAFGSAFCWALAEVSASAKTRDATIDRMMIFLHQHW